MKIIIVCLIGMLPMYNEGMKAKYKQKLKEDHEQNVVGGVYGSLCNVHKSEFDESAIHRIGCPCTICIMIAFDSLKKHEDDCICESCLHASEAALERIIKQKQSMDCLNKKSEQCDALWDNIGARVIFLKKAFKYKGYLESQNRTINGDPDAPHYVMPPNSKGLIAIHKKENSTKIALIKRKKNDRF